MLWFISDIEDIPENIKYCKNLQVADFSCNPLQRYLFIYLFIYLFRASLCMYVRHSASTCMIRSVVGVGK